MCSLNELITGIKELPEPDLTASRLMDAAADYVPLKVVIISKKKNLIFQNKNHIFPASRTYWRQRYQQ